MYNSNNKYCTLEILLNELYPLFEVNSPIFVDDLGYKWYELSNVLRLLKISEEEYINGYYLMNIGEDVFISEEGINMLLIEYDNEYRDEILNYLTEDIMPDIKSDRMYLGYDLLDSIRNISLTTILDNKTNDNEFKTASKMEGYVSKKVHRTIKREENRKRDKRNKR
jgi:hypothetical protein